MTAKKSLAEQQRVKDTLKRYRRKYESGDGSMLLFAVAYCGRHRVIQPDWLAKAFLNRFRRYAEYRVTTLDEAFRLPKRKHIAARRKEYLYKHDVFNAVTYAHYRRRIPIDDLLFADVANELGLGISTVKKLYRIARDEPEWK